MFVTDFLFQKTAAVFPFLSFLIKVFLIETKLIFLKFLDHYHAVQVNFPNGRMPENQKLLVLVA